MRLTGLVFCIVVNALFACFYGSIGASTGEDEVTVLLAIKEHLDDQSDVLQDWKAPTNGQGSAHCSWYGITCNSEGSVVSIDLSHLNISGVITDHIEHLQSLTKFNICGNAFSTSLPKALSVPLLEAFDVSENSFVGEFPMGLGSSVGLRIVNASGNNFVGPLPEDLSNATSLEELDFRGSFFSGSIPGSYGNLIKLKFLGLSGNSLTGEIPAMLSKLSSLEKLILGYNEFDGSIPPEFGDLLNLQYLDLAIGNLSGPIPSELGKLQKLTILYLYKNNLDGEIPKEIGNLSELLMLDISDNLITGPIPSELSQLKNLTLLNLMCNRLQGAVPPEISEMPNLQVLELWNNSLTGPLPSNLGQNSPLQWLDVSSNSLSGEIPMGLCNRSNLTKLLLFNNAFSGMIPPTISSCLSLVRVRIQNNQLNGTIPVGLGRLPKLQRLELASNDLEGQIPNDLTLSSSLSFIDLSHNKLQLPLPSNIFSIPTLQSFIASDNLLTGSIPDQFQDCPALTAIDLSNNRLENHIPSSIATCRRLVNLNLHGNRFSGEIPIAISMMPALAILDLSNNQLSGPIPENFGSSPALETLNLSYNKLSGPVPTNGILKSINPDELAGNSGLCDGVLPPCSLDHVSVSPERLKTAHLKHIVAGWMLGIAAVIIFCVAIFGANLLYRRWYVDGGSCLEDRLGTSRGSEGGAWPWRITAFQKLNFTSNDILGCIKEGNVVGMGATGIVYKAELQRPHTIVAVKKLWRAETVVIAETGDLEIGTDIAGEVNVLGKLRHRNIVRLLGYMHNDSDVMIIYEFMRNGSLWEALHGQQSNRVLFVDWMSRYNVAAGIAQGLAYLHHDCHPPIIHRDIKSSNILLDANLEARIADFGLARMMLKKSETVSAVAGSYGYIAPEYGYTLKVDEKTDIYSFGVVLMELVTGKKPIETEYGECQDIVGWVRDKLRCCRVEEVLDSTVGGQCKHVQEEMLLVLRIAVLCTAKLPKDRPSMRDVLTMIGEAKPRRKSSSVHVAKDKPVFTTSPDSSYV